MVAARAVIQEGAPTRRLSAAAEGLSARHPERSVADLDVTPYRQGMARDNYSLISLVAGEHCFSVEKSIENALLQLRGDSQILQ